MEKLKINQTGRTEDEGEGKIEGAAKCCMRVASCSYYSAVLVAPHVSIPLTPFP